MITSEYHLKKGLVPKGCQNKVDYCCDQGMTIILMIGSIRSSIFSYRGSRSRSRSDPILDLNIKGPKVQCKKTFTVQICQFDIYVNLYCSHETVLTHVKYSVSPVTCRRRGPTLSHTMSRNMPYDHLPYFLFKK